MELAVGQVISISPTKVRFDGDTSDQAVPLSLDAYTPATNDRVLLAKVGASWIIVGDFT
jgi:hypothetical protein